MLALTPYFKVATKFLLNKTGNVAVLLALTAPVVLGFAGLGVDVSLWERAKNNVQGAADQAALAVSSFTPLFPAIWSTLVSNAVSLSRTNVVRTE